MTFSIQIAKANKPMNVDWDKLSADVHGYVIRYGLTQMLNDAHSQVTAKTEADPVKRSEAAWALAEKKLKALESGVTRVARVGGPRGDAVATEVKRIAKANILGRAKSKGLDAKIVQTNFADWMAKYIAANESELRAAAEKAIAERESLAVDLDDLMDMGDESEAA